jgi:hypothetical protein
MKERLVELEQRVESARLALEALAERTAALRLRVQAVRVEDPPFASVPLAGAGENGVTQNGAGRDPFMPVSPPSPLASSLDRLTNSARVMTPGGDREGDDGRFVSDAWEIALINEEGK